MSLLRQMYPEVDSTAQSAIYPGLRLEPLCEQWAVETHRIIQQAEVRLCAASA